MLYFIYYLAHKIYYAISKHFKSDLNAFHVKDLNFILRSRIFLHFDGHLRASHLILSLIPSYTSYQDSGLALTVGNPLLSYINIRLARFYQGALK